MNELTTEQQQAFERGRQDIVFFAWYFLGITLHPGQIRFLRGANGIVNILVPGNRYGKAQPLTSKVLTPAGFRLMGELRTGDVVMAADGTTTRINGVFPQGKRPIYKLTFNDGSSAEADIEHIWTVKTATNRFRKDYNENGKEYANKQYGQWRNLTTRQLLELNPNSSKQRPIIPMVEPIEFPAQDVPLEPYLLGSLLGGGSLKHSVRFTTADPEVLDYMDVDWVHAGRYDYRFRGIAKQLTALGLRGGSEQKFVPQQYLLNTPEVRLETLRGLMDTDGSIGKNGIVEFYTISPQLAEDVKFLVESLGGKTKIATRHTYYTHKGERRRGKLSYRIAIGMTINPFKLKRKAQLFDAKKPGVTNNRILRKIEYIGEKEAQCISIEHPSHLYVTDNFIVTHNTVLLAVRHLWHCFYKVGLHEGDEESWAKAEYKTAALAPSGEVLEVMYKTLMAILTSSFPVNRDGEPLRTNVCRIQWYLVPERCRSTAPYFIQLRDNTFIKFHSGSDDKFSSVQGKKYGYGGYDEGGRSYHLEYELKSNLIPRFQELEAPIDLASTPDQKSPSIAYHYKIFQQGQRREQGFVSFEGAADENIFLSDAYLKGIEKAYSLGDGKFDPIYDQVRYGKFVFGGTSVLQASDIDRAIDPSLNGGQQPTPKHSYIIGSDTASSTDEICHTVLDVTGNISEDNPMRLVHSVAFKGYQKSPDMHVYDFTVLFDEYNFENRCRHNLECFSEGGQIFYKNLPRYIQRKTKHYAWNGPPNARVKNEGSNGFKKAELVIALKKAFTRGHIRIPEDDQELITQLRMYREDDEKIKQDRVMALACAVWMAIEGRPTQQVATAVAVPWM